MTYQSDDSALKHLEMLTPDEKVKTENAIQVITEEQAYNEAEIIPFVSNIKDKDYHVISIFGSQSSGKSTLLNNLFGTRFQTMNEQISRGQTTKGIWMSNRAIPEKNKNLLIMDVEGSDGIEKSEDKDFERKACLFALSSSEVLMVNVWENQIGLYQGNNMELLKIVFEVNLQLFQDSNSTRKVLLLFVIRDYIGNTPLESHKLTLCNELEKMWEGIKKPEQLQDAKFTDFFDLEFRGFPHFVFQNDKFLDACLDLRNEFDSEKIFNEDKYKISTKLPLDGWEMYTSNCWKVISSSEQLDLPTQQILVAKFKTKEISKKLLEEYKNLSKSLLEDFTGNYKAIQGLLDQTLVSFKESGGRYMESVYVEEKSSLLKEIQELNFESISNNIDQKIHENILSKNIQNELFKKEFVKATPSFVDRCLSLTKSFEEDYQSELEKYANLSLINQEQELQLIHNYTSYVKSVLEEENKKEASKLRKKINRELFKHLEEYLEISVSKPSENFWDDFKQFYKKTLSKILEKYIEVDGSFKFPLNFNEEETQAYIKELSNDNIKALNKSIKGISSVQKLVLILEEQYKNIFLSDPETHAPRMFEVMNLNDMETLHETCKSKCEIWLQQFSKGMDLTGVNSEIYNLESSLVARLLVDESSDSDASDLDEGDTIINELKLKRVLQEFTKKVNIISLQSRRIIVQSSMNTKVPGYMYALLLFLGYGKILYVIKNPMMILLVVMLLSTWYFVHKSGQYQFVVLIITKWFEMAKQIVVAKLKEFVENNDKQNDVMKSQDSFEMEDLSLKKGDTETKTKEE
ncbi:related to Protein SEY1 [Hanseniaspora guilliermondii]|uniref:Related to Protein SEY1 n=1 Tax=Hanseniaspora guilliermondii TaxID=56406 RepID=A0A1L0CJK4_9ASCO|nr:related to Protein SEY1 [Hanseniaspora guilliermondii]